MSDAVKTYGGFSTRRTPQSEPIPGEVQVENNAGGFVYAIDKWAQLARFLIIGTQGGTYYVQEQPLTRENAEAIVACAKDDPARLVETVAAVSEAGRAPKNEPAIFALALAATLGGARSLALVALPRVCRIPTHLFAFLTFYKMLSGGFGRSVRRAIGDWYARWNADQLAYELVKYQSRNGWANRDALRLAHASFGPDHQSAIRWAIGASPTVERTVVRRNAADKTFRYGPAVAPLPAIIAAFEEAKTADRKRLIHLILEAGLTREMVPSAALNDPDVWAALLSQMPLTALVRNLGKMTAVGLLAPLSDGTRIACAYLADGVRLRASRVHPLVLLNALQVYRAGHGDKGALTWSPVAAILDALDSAFYDAFGNVAPTNKRLLLALDVSGSMQSPIAGTGLTCREAVAALALVTARVEPQHALVAFSNTGRHPSPWAGYMSGLTELAISPQQRLDDVVEAMGRIPFGGTDCALPMIYAQERGLNVDAFCLYTDNETWAGDIHPSQALRAYRRTHQPEAKLVVTAMTSTGFSIADPADPGMLDVVGFDLATPQAVSAFIAG